MTVHLHPPTFQDPLVGSVLGATFDSGCTNQPREAGIGATAVTVSGTLILVYFRAPRAFTAANMAFYTGLTAAAATPTLIKYALFSVAANGDLTRIATTASDTALLAAASTRYPKVLTASVGVTAGLTYATGFLIVTGAATPTLIAPTAYSTGGGVAAAQAPRMLGAVAAQTDILASYTAAQVVNTTVRHLAEITT